MKWRKSILGLVLTGCYLVGAAVIIKSSECSPGVSFLCGKIVGALVAAFPWTFPFWENAGEDSTMIAASAAGIAVNAVIVYTCGWAVEDAFRSKRLP